MSSIGIIFEELPQRCESCGIIAETLPFGVNREEICLDCAKKDEALTWFRAKEIIYLGDGSENY